MIQTFFIGCGGLGVLLEMQRHDHHGIYQYLPWWIEWKMHTWHQELAQVKFGSPISIRFACCPNIVLVALPPKWDSFLKLGTLFHSCKSFHHHSSSFIIHFPKDSSSFSHGFFSLFRQSLRDVLLQLQVARPQERCSGTRGAVEQLWILDWMVFPHLPGERCC